MATVRSASTTTPPFEFVDAVAGAFMALVDLRDLSTGRHSTQIVEFAVDVGMHFGWHGTRLRELEIAAMLHDLGKVGVPDRILNKQRALDADETEHMRRHPEYGWAVLRNLPGFEQVALFILHHHERWDGGGYPAGLRGEEIPLGARILAVVDAFHAIVSDRPYRKGQPITEACRRLRRASGTQFDPGVVAVFTEYARDLMRPGIASRLREEHAAVGNGAQPPAPVIRLSHAAAAAHPSRRSNRLLPPL